jgi:hypothetical protein
VGLVVKDGRKTGAAATLLIGRARARPHAKQSSWEDDHEHHAQRLSAIAEYLSKRCHFANRSGYSLRPT